VVAQCADQGTEDPAAGRGAAAAGQDPTAVDPAAVDGAPRPGAIPDDAPRVRFAITGSMGGKLEPCGCASAQLGGLPRRLFHLRQDQRYDLRIEGGNMVKAPTPLDGLKLFTALQALHAVENPYSKYHVQAVGPRDIALPNDDFAIFTGALDVPLVSADLVRTLPEIEGMPWTAKPFRDFEVKGIPVRITALTLTLPEGTEGWELAAPQDAWTKAMAGATPETLRVLMVHGGSETTRSFATLDPKPDLLIGVNDEHVEPPLDAEVVDGVPVVFPGSEGRCVLEVTLCRLEDGPRLGYHVVELAGSRTDKTAMQDETARSLILQHRMDAAEQGMREAMAEREPTANGNTYTGTASCTPCHQDDHQVWAGSKHAQAWKTLVDADNSERYPWPTTQYPDCIGCHTVGYGEVSGFVNPEATPELQSVGCESCHGPGSAHVADPEVKMGPVGSLRCIKCHDHDQSPDFDYNQRWLMIRHGAK